MNIFEAIKKGDAILREIGIKSHKIDSEILMSRVIKKNRADIILNSKNELSQKLNQKYSILSTRQELKKEGFSLNEETLANGTVRLVARKLG